MREGGKERFLLLATTLAYFLIALEVLFMITPFALYFYGVYGPILKFLAGHPLTAWTTEFFLPHMVFVSDPFLVGLSYLQVLFVVGLALFLAAAVPLYFGRLTGRGVVSFGFYSRIRHPQYLFLALSGFGLLLYWPRFIVLIFFITMLFIYYLLARNEEWRMKREHPGSYESYMEKSWMFLPGEPGGRIYATLFGWIRPRGLGILVVYALVLLLSVAAAFGLRDYSVSRLPAVEAREVRLVSVYPRDMEHVRMLHEIALEEPEVRRAVKERGLQLAYIMPGDFFLTGLILREGPRFTPQQLERWPHLRNWADKTRQGDLEKFFRLGYKYFRTIGTTRRVYDYERFVFVECVGPEGGSMSASEALQVGVRRYPSLVVDLDFETHEVVGVFEASGENVWGRLPMPSL